MNYDIIRSRRCPLNRNHENRFDTKKNHANTKQHDLQHCKSYISELKRKSGKVGLKNSHCSGFDKRERDTRAELAAKTGR
ncbi:hypothetical protein J6590_012206 [Homalodisca vitripennis]|nr:hypothetical protein J6590_012206 [Homalodisca vitripennis]